MEKGETAGYHVFKSFLSQGCLKCGKELKHHSINRRVEKTRDCLVKGQIIQASEKSSHNMNYLRIHYLPLFFIIKLYTVLFSQQAELVQYFF